MRQIYFSIKSLLGKFFFLTILLFVVSIAYHYLKIVIQIPIIPQAYASTIIATDTFQRANQSGWGTASDGQKWGADGQNGTFFSIKNNTGQIDNSGGESYNAIIGPAVGDSEIVFTGYVSNSCEYGNMGAILRWQDANDWYKAYVASHGTNSTCDEIDLQKRVSGTYYDLVSVSYNISPGTTFSMRFKITGNTMYVRVWTGASEPATWNINGYTDPGNTSTGNILWPTGNVGLRAEPNTQAYNTIVHYTSFTAWDDSISNCTTGASNCTACTGAAPNTCSNNGTQTCTHNQTQPCNPVTFTRTCSINACYAGYTCSSGTCIKTSFNLSGQIFVDYNNNGVNNNQDDPYANKQITVTALQTSGSQVGSTYTDTQTDTNGNYTITNVPNGTYTITITVPSGYIASTTNPITGVIVNNTDVSNENFGIAPTFTISGVVYNDNDGDQFYDNNDTLYPGSSTITINGTSAGNTINKTITFSGGTYNSNTAIKLPAGTYSVSYTSPPGYFMSYIQNGPPATFTNLVLGTPQKNPSCSIPTSPPGPYNSVSCDTNGNIVNLNFGISHVEAWMQSVCGDMRADGGLNDPVPASYTCGSTSATGYAITTNATCPTHPGVFFSGSNSYQFIPGQVSSKNWIAGGGNTVYTETFSPVTTGVMRTSYSYMMATAKQSGTPTTDLATVNGCSVSSTNGQQIYTCTLSSSLHHGLYVANGPLTLNGFTVPTSPANTSYGYVILVNGDVTINGSIVMPPSTNSTFIISTSGNIIIPSTIGQASPSDPTATLAGFYSADKSFIIQPGSGSCSTGRVDKRLNIEGSIVVNAGQQGGTFQNQRNLCLQNTNCPSVVFTQRPDLILNAPPFIKHTNSLFQEIAP